MRPNRVALLERTVLAAVERAFLDYQDQMATIFWEETDLAQDIAEDITREAIDAMGLSEIHERLYGKVDLKKAIYVFAPEVEPVALMLDAKAEKGAGSATIQMSQTSMTVKQKRGGESINVKGKLAPFIQRGEHKLLVVTIVAKFVYSEASDDRNLDQIILACIPNGLLQKRYNPNTKNTIWLAGRNAPSLNEEFRVRLSFAKLREISPWRVRKIY
ncbi:MAG: BglI family type II restriction endonuclease [Acidimicrobiia bacterium]|nr:BglI family type II restriction endonuclease [Acidimicrobiia bacterium]MCY4457149.1 BglI family type II restriction endonuclease [Acidimicrobiaceae bacterium]